MFFGIPKGSALRVVHTKQTIESAERFAK